MTSGFLLHVKTNTNQNKKKKKKEKEFTQNLYK